GRTGRLLGSVHAGRASWQLTRARRPRPCLHRHFVGSRLRFKNAWPRGLGGVGPCAGARGSDGLTPLRLAQPRKERKERKEKKVVGEAASCGDRGAVRAAA